MKFFIAFALLFITSTWAKPSGHIAPIAFATIPFSNQYHAQDGLGQYTYGYSNELSAKAEARSLDGKTVGGYRYLDATGKIQTVEYSSDSVNGFRVAASNLPVSPAVPKVEAPVPPVPVQDTPEVVEAKAKHLAALKEAEVRAAQADLVVPTVEVKSILTPGAVVAGALPALVPLHGVALTPAVATPAVETKSAKLEELEQRPADKKPEPEPQPNPSQQPPLETRSSAVPSTSTVAIKSFASPAIAIKSAPLLSATPAFSYSYSLGPVYSYNAIVAEPAAIAASYSYHPQIYTVPAVVQRTEAKEEEKDKNE